MLVVDASAAVHLSLRGALDRLRPHGPAAPSLLWSETTAALRQLAWRGDIDDAHAREAIAALGSGTIAAHPSSELAAGAYDRARALGWARTYDAEYLALAERLDCPLLTLDARLARTAARFVVVAPPASI